VWFGWFAVQLREAETLLQSSGNSFDPAALRALPPGAFVGFNRISGMSLAGRVFYEVGLNGAATGRRRYFHRATSG
jgi:hypothetical protein